MKTYKVDLDYESFLFDPNYVEDSPASLKIIKEFEYVFFLVNQESCVLKNYRNYDKNYLNKIKKLGFIIPELNSEAQNAQSWWGNRHDYVLEKKLNSKITSVKIASENGWGFEKGIIASNSNEVVEHLQKNTMNEKWIIKRPHGFSGIGHYQFSSKNVNRFILDKILESEVLLEPLHERLFDIGTTFIVENGVIKRQFMVENFNSAQGGFRGGTGCSHVENFKKYIEKKYSYNLNELEKITNQIAKKYIELGAIYNIQIDSFVYLENGIMKLYPLVEVNYRKTMGLVIQTLADRFNDCERIEWLIRTQKEISEDAIFYDRENMTRLSPDGVHFQTYFIRY